MHRAGQTTRVALFLVLVATSSLVRGAETTRASATPDGPSGVGAARLEASSTVSLPDMLVTPATRLSLSLFEQPYAVYRHDRLELDNGAGRTALDRIDYGPGVIIQHTAPGQTSPYIRGLTGKQSLLLLDGVRLSHATMRGGPNQYFALIPDMSIDSIDAILGASSVVNGSDGLTGALDTRLAPAGRGVGKAYSPWVSARVDTANGYQTAAGFDGESGDWRYTLEGAFYDFHDREGGKNSSDNVFGVKDGDKIPNTAYDQWAVAGRAAYDGFADRSLELAFGYTRQNDARRPDGYFQNSGKSSRISRYYDPETFTYVHLRDIWAADTALFDMLTTTLWWHQQDENQIREDVSSSTVYRRREYDDRIDSIGLEPQATIQLADHGLTYGVFALFEKTSNAYREFRNLTGTDPAGATPYKVSDWAGKTTVTDGAKYNTYAAYVQDLWQLTDRFSLLPGLRYTYVAWDLGNSTRHTDDIAGGMRASYALTENTLAFVGASKAFRAPNLDDLDGIGDRASSGKFSEGNPNMDPEVSYTGETGWRYAAGRDGLGVSLFYTELKDVIQRTYDAAGNEYRDNGEGATLQGFELEWNYGLPVTFGERLALVGCVSYVDSEEDLPQEDGSIVSQPMSRANRLYGRAGVRCELTQNWWAQTQVRFHDAYDEGDLGSGDSRDVRLTVPGNGDGTIPGFGVVDVSAGWTDDAGTRWVTMTVENVADKTYRQLGSGADAPGLNLALAGGVRF